MFIFSQFCHVTYHFTGQSDTTKAQQHTLIPTAAQKQIISVWFPNTLWLSHLLKYFFSKTFISQQAVFYAQCSWKTTTPPHLSPYNPTSLFCPLMHWSLIAMPCFLPPYIEWFNVWQAQSPDWCTGWGNSSWEKCYSMYRQWQSRWKALRPSNRPHSQVQVGADHKGQESPEILETHHIPSWTR